MNFIIMPSACQSVDQLTSASLATQFTLPAAGQYTIGVFRITLVEPEAVEPTVFQFKVR